MRLDSSLEPAQTLTRFSLSSANSVVFTKWRSDSLPEDLLVSLELFVCFSEAWIWSRVAAAPDPSGKTYELHSARVAEAEPEPIDLLDPSTRKRIVTPVRGLLCNHLEVSGVVEGLGVKQRS